MTSHPCGSLFLSEVFSDVTFVVENQSIPAHKMLLAANCPYFQTMLFGATNESKMAVVELNNVSHKVFVEVLRCVYLRKVDISEWTPEEVKNLVQKADEYQFPDMGSVIAESLNIDTQVTIDIIEDVVGVAKRLNCNGLMEKCAEFARNHTGFLFSDCEAFEKLPMDLIIHLIDNKVWNPADPRLVFSIGNWRMTGSIEDKKRLLSKIDWKSLPGKYSEPLVRMFLENDAPYDSLQMDDWTNRIKTSSADVKSADGNLVAVYSSFDRKLYEGKSHVGRFLQGFQFTLNKESQHVFLFFQKPVADVHKIKFMSECSVNICLKLYGDMGVKVVYGVKRDNYWEFDIPLNVTFSSAALQFEGNATTYMRYEFKFLRFCR